MVLIPLLVRGLSARIINVGTDAASPFTTIQAAIDAASDGDIVVVADGTYTGIGNRDINFCGKAITVRSATGPERCLIDCQGAARGFLFSGGEKESSVLDGFTILGARAERGAGIYCTLMSNPTIAHCILRDNEALQGGGGIYISAGGPIITGCTFLANRSSLRRICDDEDCSITRASGGAILSLSSRPTIQDCNFTGNLAAGQGGAVCSMSSVVSLANCTFTINDANNSGGAVYSADDSTVLLVDCSFEENAADENGGAVAVVESSTTIQRSTFTGCRTRGHDGGAIANLYGTLTLDTCVLQDNRAGADGGALADFDSNSVMLDCIFSANAAYEDGGAIYAWQTSLILTGCTFTENSARDDGGALHQRAARFVSMTGCHFLGNSARDNGGAIFNRYDTSPELWHCVFSDNNARSAGGGIYNRDGSSPRLFNCLFFGNRAGDSGGAVYSRNNSDPILTNCTITGNTAGFEGGGVMSWDDCRPELKNCILWGNVTEEGVPEQTQVQGGMPHFSFCCIESYGRDRAGTGSITSDPLFVPGICGDYYLSQEAAGQANTSPCCDAGTMPPAATDFAGFTTRTDQAPDSVPLDMGYHYPVIVPAGPSSGDGGK
jgi:predicted outer membrane repeat protein